MRKTINQFAISFTALASLFLGSCAHSPQSKNLDVDSLNATIAEYTDATKHLDPYWATYFNIDENLDKFGDYGSPDFFSRSKKIIQDALNKLKTVNAEKLSAADKKTYHLFKEDLETSLRGFDFPIELIDFTQMSNRLLAYLDDSSQELTNFPFDSVKHYRDFVKRASGFGHYIDNQIELFRRGIREKITLSCIAAKATANTWTPALISEVEKNPFFRPIQFMPKNFSATDRAQLTEDFRKMVTHDILPGYKKFDRFFKNEYMPHCRKNYGIGALPNSKEWYAYSILSRTNLKISPQKIHQIGLEEVRRISNEMKEIQKTLGFKGTFKEFLKSLRDNPDYYFTTSKDLVAAFEAVRVQTGKIVPAYFSVAPKSECRLVESSNPEDAAASYRDPTENLPYGRFVMNTLNLRSIPKYGVTTLFLHEAIPGHHFQLALQFEMKDQLSEYQRKLFGSTSFVEGWALYAEYLGREMGLFSDPLQRLGNLNDEMLRAVRLVVDTGIHAFGWSQKRTLEFMNRHLASDPKGLENEANRYSVWPGQALGYKLGQLKIIELRRLAASQLGSRFDIKGFHQAVIGGGTVSLGLLEQQVKEWIETQKAH